MNLTPRQIGLIKSGFRKLEPISTTFAELFYTRLFALDPGLGKLFQPASWQDAGRALMQIMGAMVSNLGRLDSLAPAVSALGRFHLAYVLRPTHFDLGGQALIWTLARSLEDDFTDEAKLAWLDAYSLLASIMEQGMREKISTAGRGDIAAAA